MQMLNLPDRQEVAVESVVVAIPADLKRRLDMYISQCPLEISGLGTVESRNGTLVVTGLYLLDQQVTAAETVLSAETILAFMAEAPARGIDVSKLRLWWHSHARMAPFWSPTDERAVESFNMAPWFVSIVGNHDGDYLTRVDVFPSETVGFRMAQTAQLRTIYVADELAAVRNEIQQRVQKAAPPSKKTPPRKVVGAKAGLPPGA